MNQKESLEEWAARINAMPENPDSLAVLGRINRTGSALPTDAEIERRQALLDAAHAEERAKFRAAGEGTRRYFKPHDGELKVLTASQLEKLREDIRPQFVVPAALMAAQTAVAERLVREGVAALRTRIEQAGGRVTIIADEVIIERTHSDTAATYDIKAPTIGFNLPKPVTREEMLAAKGTDKQPEMVARIDAYIEALAACACKVAGCDPTGVRECEKGIRERRELP